MVGHEEDGRTSGGIWRRKLTREIIRTRHVAKNPMDEGVIMSEAEYSSNEILIDVAVDHTLGELQCIVTFSSLQKHQCS